jgi:hypothetical protein
MQNFLRHLKDYMRIKRRAKYYNSPKKSETSTAINMTHQPPYPPTRRPYRCSRQRQRRTRLLIDAQLLACILGAYHCGIAPSRIALMLGVPLSSLVGVFRTLNRLGVQT